MAACTGVRKCAQRDAISLAPLSVVVPDELPVSEAAEIAPDPLSINVPARSELARLPAVSWFLIAILPDDVMSGQVAATRIDCAIDRERLAVRQRQPACSRIRKCVER